MLGGYFTDAARPANTSLPQVVMVQSLVWLVYIICVHTAVGPMWVSRGCLERVLCLFEGLLEGVWRVSGL